MQVLLVKKSNTKKKKEEEEIEVFRNIISVSHCHCCCSVTQSYPVLLDHMDYSIPDFPIPHYHLGFVQVHVHCYSDAISHLFH